MGKKFEDFFTRKAEIFSNPIVFSLEYEPQEIEKNKPFYELTQEVASFTKYRISENILVVGNSGTGKTISALYIRKKMNNLLKEKKITRPLYIFYVNCKNRDSRGIFTGLNIEEWPEGTEHNNVVSFFNGVKTDFVLILDEIDKGKNLDSFLYKLSRPKSVIQNFTNSICLILISNDLAFEEKLEQETRSSLNLKTVKFNNHSKSSLYQILTARLVLGLKKGEQKLIKRQTLLFLAEKISDKYDGDARYAITVLRRAIQKAEAKGKESITENDLTKMLGKVCEEFEQKELSELSEKQFFTLYACIKNTARPLSSIYDYYKMKASRGIFPLVGRTTFYIQIDYLETHGFIEKEFRIFQQAMGVREKIIKVKISDKLIFQEYTKRTYTKPKKNGSQIL